MQVPGETFWVCAAVPEGRLDCCYVPDPISCSIVLVMPGTTLCRQRERVWTSNRKCIAMKASAGLIPGTSVVSLLCRLAQGGGREAYTSAADHTVRRSSAVQRLAQI